jgi:peptidyl-tRNA hydrolase, PTH1 family
MKLIVGLGNPGTEYEGTRHNVGFEAIKLLAARHGIAVTKRNYRAVYGEGTISGEKVLLVRPMTFMNLSGESVGAICRFYKIPPEDVWVIYDDIALEVGKIRLRFQGSAGGHNGMKSLIQHLGTQEFPRLRIGVGGVPGERMINHVLGKFRPEERPVIAEACERACDAVEFALSDTFVNAMNRFNG